MKQLLLIWTAFLALAAGAQTGPGVGRILAGSGVTVIPASGVGQVTVSAAGGGGGGILSNIFQFGAYGDAQFIPTNYGQLGCNMTNGSPHVSCSSANWSSVVAGESVEILFASAANDAQMLHSTVLSVQGPTNMTLADNASATTPVNGGWILWGHDDTQAFLSAIAYETNAGGAIVQLPPANYLVDGPFTYQTSETSGVQKGYCQVMFPTNSDTIKNSAITVGFQGLVPPAPNGWAADPAYNTTSLKGSGAIIYSWRCPPRTNTCCYNTAVMGMPYNPGPNGGIGYVQLYGYFENLTFRGSPIPMATALDMTGVSMCELHNISVDNSSISANWQYNSNFSGAFNDYSNFATVGISFPSGNNQALCYGDNLSVIGYPIGISLDSHAKVESSSIWACFCGLELSGQSYLGYLGGITIQDCAYGMTGLFTGPSVWNISALDFEAGGEVGDPIWGNYTLRSLIHNPDGFLGISGTFAGYSGNSYSFPIVDGPSTNMHLWDASNSIEVDTFSAYNLNTPSNLTVGGSATITNSLTVSNVVVGATHSGYPLSIFNTTGASAINIVQTTAGVGNVISWNTANGLNWNLYVGWVNSVHTNSFFLQDAVDSAFPMIIDGSPINTIAFNSWPLFGNAFGLTNLVTSNLTGNVQATNLTNALATGPINGTGLFGVPNNTNSFSYVGPFTNITINTNLYVTNTFRTRISVLLNLTNGAGGTSSCGVWYFTSNGVNVTGPTVPMAGANIPLSDSTTVSFLMAPGDFFSVSNFNGLTSSLQFRTNTIMTLQ
jgi:hypothetical protein